MSLAMVEEITALVENSGVFLNGTVNESHIDKMSRDNILFFCHQISDITSIDNVKHVSGLSHSASLSLSGGRTPCGCFQCRSNEITNLIQFASLYSDIVYTYNFLGDYLINHGNAFTTISDDALKGMFKKDIKLFSLIYPLVLQGYILPVTLPGICPRCHNIRTLDGALRNSFIEAQSEIASGLIENIDFHLQFCGTDLAITAHGPEHLLAHGREHYHIGNDQTILEYLRLSPDKLRMDGRHLIPKEAVAKNSLHKGLVESVFKSVGFELTSSAKLKASFLSNRDIEFDILKNLNGDNPMSHRSQLMQKYLTCFVPFIQNIDSHNLIKLRKEEGEAFIVFRSSLIKAIGEFKTSSSEFTEFDARMVFSDIVEPSLAKLDLKLKAAGSKLTKDTRRDIFGWVGAISAGIYAGLLSADIKTGTLTFGAVKATADFLSSTMKNSDLEENVKDNDMYFLWKVQNLQRQ